MTEVEKKGGQHTSESLKIGDEKWKPVERNIVIKLTETIPDRLVPHLKEWAGLRYKILEGDITWDEEKSLRALYVEEHDELFDDRKFSLAIRTITEMIKMPEAS